MESSKRKSNESPELPFDEESEGRPSIRNTPKQVSSKATSRIASISKAFSRGLLGKRAEEKPRHSGRPKVDYMRAPPFTDDINEEKLPSNFKLPAIPSYDGRGDPKDHIHAFILAFWLYCILDPVICRIFLVFLQEIAQKWFWVCNLGASLL